MTSPPPQDSKSSACSLQQFQQSDGIPFGDQIILLNNPQLFDGYTPYFYPRKKTKPLDFIKRIFFKPPSLSATSRIFAGYFDHSFDHLDQLKPLFDAIRHQSQSRFEVVIGKGDYLANPQFLQSIPENVHTLFLNNLNDHDSRLRYLPMGRDFRSIDVFRERKPGGDKRMLCYCNFSTNTHPIRKQIAEALRDKPFISKQHLGKFLKYEISRAEFYDDLQSAKFCICPRGNAYDTFRMWDALYCGTIPIVVREAVFHELLLDLPILFLDHPREFAELDEPQLERIYEEMVGRKYNFEKLKASAWLN